jgi:hypothetical protein
MEKDWAYNHMNKLEIKNQGRLCPCPMLPYEEYEIPMELCNVDKSKLQFGSIVILNHPTALNLDQPTSTYTDREQENG